MRFPYNKTHTIIARGTHSTKATNDAGNYDNVGDGQKERQKLGSHN